MEGKELINAITARHIRYQQIENSLHAWKIRRFMASRWSKPNRVESVEINGQIYRL